MGLFCLFVFCWGSVLPTNWFKTDSQLTCFIFSRFAEEQTCPKPPTPRNGTLHSNYEKYTPGSTVTYQCDGDLNLVGSATITCMDHGQWEPQGPPTCQGNIRNLCARNKMYILQCESEMHKCILHKKDKGSFRRADRSSVMGKQHHL